jgi:hypothetical protein
VPSTAIFETQGFGRIAAGHRKILDTIFDNRAGRHACAQTGDATRNLGAKLILTRFTLVPPRSGWRLPKKQLTRKETLNVFVR